MSPGRPWQVRHREGVRGSGIRDKCEWTLGKEERAWLVMSCRARRNPVGEDPVCAELGDGLSPLKTFIQGD